MIKLSTGLTSIPISNVPGSEDVEINYMEAEDAEASNSGGFNQLDISSFPKELEVEKDMDKKAYLRKKADGDTGQSVGSRDFMTGDLAKSESLAAMFLDIVSDLDLSMQGFASHSGLNIDAYRPGFLVKNTYDDNFSPDDWTLKFFRFVALSADFESGPGKSNHPERVPNIVKGWRALYLAGEQTGDAYENAMQDAFDYGSFSFLNLDDDMFHSLAGIANAMVRFKELKQEYNSVRVGGVQNSSVSSSQPTGAVVQMEFLDFPPGTELKDIGGTNSYRILSASELILKKDDGSSMTINSSNAAKNGVNWSLLVQNLSDDTKTMVSDMVVEGSYKKDFNISKVSKNMRKELIKMNSALNGLGYRNLVKVAGSNEPDTADGGPYELGESDAKDIDFPFETISEEDSYYESDTHERVTRNHPYPETGPTYYHKNPPPTYTSTSTSTGGSERTVTMPSVKKEPVKIIKTWPEYINSATDQDLRNKYNQIRILWQQYAGSNPDQVGHKDRMAFETYKAWWKENYGVRKGSGGPLEVIQDLEIEVSKLANSRDVIASYKKDFNISKVSKDMREELIKLNSALNGLGYRNLVKIADDSTDFLNQFGRLSKSSGSEVNTGDIYLNTDYKIVFKCTFKNPLLRYESYRDMGRTPYFISNIYNYVEEKEVKEYKLFDLPIFIKIEQDFFQSKQYSEYLRKNLADYNEVLYCYNDFKQYGSRLPESTNESSSTAEIPTAAGTPGVSTRPAPKKRTPVTTWEGYIASAGGDADLKEKYENIRILWIEFIDTEIQLRKKPEKEGDAKVDRIQFNQYVRWWKLTYSKGGGGPDEVIDKLKNLIRDAATTNDTTVPAPAASAAPAAPAASAPASSAMSVTETVNGKPSVSIGTRGGDQIYLVLESVDRGVPLLYRKDNRTGQIKEMTSNEVIQFRNSLNNREIRRLEDAISRATKSPERAEAFKRYMKLQRRDNRFGRIGEKRREEKMTEQSREMKSSSTRQSRLDTLRKKGVI